MLPALSPLPDEQDQATPTQAQPQGPQPPQVGPQPLGGPPTALPSPSPAPPVTIDAVMGLLQNKALRRFRIDIEADSTIVGDESQEKQDRTQLIESTVKLLQVSGPMIQAEPMLAPLFGEMLLFGIRAFRVGRPLEEVVEETVDKLDAAAGQPKPPPQPSPDELVKLQGTQAKTQAEIQKAQLGVQQAQADHASKTRQTQMDAEAAERDAQHAYAEHQMKLQAMQAEMIQRQQEMAANQIAHQQKLELMKTQHEHAMKQARQPKGEKR